MAINRIFQSLYKTENGMINTAKTNLVNTYKFYINKTEILVKTEYQFLRKFAGHVLNERQFKDIIVISFYIFTRILNICSAFNRMFD